MGSDPTFPRLFGRCSSCSGWPPYFRRCRSRKPAPQPGRPESVASQCQRRPTAMRSAKTSSPCVALGEDVSESKSMTDTSLTPEAPDAAQIAHFLRRFADMMSVGHNATYLAHAADMLDTLAAQVTAAQDEEQL